jgi:putative sigma-54 modulation protein
MQIQTEIFYSTKDTLLVSSIEQKVSKLGRFLSRLSEARIVLKFENCLLTKERTAEIKIHVPNGIIFIKESSKTFDIALDKALVALKVQLLKYKTKRLNHSFY